MFKCLLKWIEEISSQKKIDEIGFSVIFIFDGKIGFSAKIGV